MPSVRSCSPVGEAGNRSWPFRVAITGAGSPLAATSGPGRTGTWGSMLSDGFPPPVRGVRDRAVQVTTRSRGLLGLNPSGMRLC